MQFTDIDEMRAAVGNELGTGAWRVVGQDRIEKFADATDDHQWIHTDPARAAAGPFGATVAHGFLTVSLLPALCEGLYSVQGAVMAVNYGLNKVRFPAPVPAGSRIRARARLAEVTPVPGGVQVVTVVTVEREGGDKPVCVAESVARIYLADSPQ
ncbi:MaoC family dehydratase [Actinospica durhamensis]|uniref:MaoC family dehydratase n=1 Tax=Actinospica durhamensis TaxID=1508375 RepID=A0A941ENN6_9ACTN|nr:MaoC family dehydratase [Actinospica durhamensis]MBR7834278.1 MaoC family dehydratase [Actinospica durhamensis]